MTTIGLRELRQQASELLRRVEGGEQVLITVAGRPSARLVPVSPRAWRSWTDVADLFDGPADLQWDTDRNRLDDDLRDPWHPTQ
ncbi:type II toxin-antitoxin system prevent-host-death family antitoxin [Aquipuribacter hungaricus]|uniref:Antitoxin n=1 Tax=Aquipuribacter hungaricus TaxID=545624 RepID=A0ABV7WBY0_9MICO